jgi:hypothetical protein
VASAGHAERADTPATLLRLCADHLTHPTLRDLATQVETRLDSVNRNEMTDWLRRRASVSVSAFQCVVGNRTWRTRASLTIVGNAATRIRIRQGVPEKAGHGLGEAPAGRASAPTAVFRAAHASRPPAALKAATGSAAPGACLTTATFAVVKASKATMT